MEPIRFQIIDILSDDIATNEGEYWDKEFVITFYGKTKDDLNIACSVTGFRPFFYLRIPDNWGDPLLRKFLKIIKEFISSIQLKPWNGNYEQELLETKQSYNFYGYNYDNDYDKIKTYRFAKISFKNYGDLRKCTNAIEKFHKVNTPLNQHRIIIGYKNKKPIYSNDERILKWFTQEHNCDCVANLYESKIHPFLRFLHTKNIQPCGWVTVDIKNETFLIDENDQYFNVDIEIRNIPMSCIQPYQSEETAPFVTASFDIECDSSHGDFPNPCKDFKKLVIDIHESYFRLSISQNSLDFKRRFLLRCIEEAFQDGSENVQCIYTINGTYSEDSLKELEEKFTDEFIEQLDDSKSSSKKRETMINEFTKILNNLQNNDGEEIMIKGDPIIQIGTVFHKYGETSCYDRSIIVIGNEYKPDEKICDDIQDVNVYECSSERELLLKWKDLILFHNPDLLTGYNIFGFDFDYINKRVDYLFPHHESCGESECKHKEMKYKCKHCKDLVKSRYCNYRCPKYEFYRLGRLMRNRDSDKIESLTTLSKSKTSLKYYNNFWEKRCQVVKKELSSSGLGDNILNYISMDGRVLFDIQKEIQKGHSLDSYKLDNVSSHFMKGKIKTQKRYKGDLDINFLYTNNLGNLKINDYITINLHTKYGAVKYMNGKKFKILQLGQKLNVIGIKERINIKKYKQELIYYEWCLAKDDVSPQQIFDFHKNGGSEGRAKIAKYCIMDCELCIHLLLLLDIIPNNMGMANVSSVPLSYIFLRGQGIKISSLVVKACSNENTRIPTLRNYNGEENNEGFEGAIVLEPNPGIYLEDPISVLDYASLYPSSIIEKNLSHETFIGTEEEIQKNPKKYEWLKNIQYNVISYDDYSYVKKGKTLHKKKEDTQTTCYFAKEESGSRGIIPTILQTLLDQRKATRLKIRETDNEDKKKVLDGLQLAYKVTANSVYGQMGARTSSIFFKKFAACTTASGRDRIDDASIGVKNWAKEEGYEEPEIVYGDTDSVFIKFSRIDKETGELLKGKEALQYCIDCGIQSGKWITKNMLNNPQDLEYEKTFFPFILISKKRYTGDKYEYSSDILKERTSMGIVMKRRDNAAIVKYVFGNVIEIIMNQKDIDLAMHWLKETLTKIKNGLMDDSMFIISKSLSAYYKNPDGIAHKVLADRMAERNPGDKPKPNDRIPFMYRVVDDTPTIIGYKKSFQKVENGKYKNGKPKYKKVEVQGEPKFKKKKILQGDRIEHPDYIRENNIQIDYSFYISNQIMNPVKQVLDLEKEEEVTQTLFDPFI